MRICFLLLSLLCAQLLFSQKTSVDIQHYRFEIELSDSSNNIRAWAFITAKFTDSASGITLDLVNADTSGKGMKVYRALENGHGISFKHERNKLVMQLASPAKAGETKTFEVLYAGVPADGLIISKNKYGERTFFADNWPDRARNWLPCVDHPSDKASVEFVVTAPVHYQVVSNGIQMEEININDAYRKTYWKETALLPTKIMVIGVARFAVQYVGDTLGVPLYSWLYPADAEKGFYDYAQAKDVLPYFINNIGPYPYQKLANVQSKTIFGGMENAGCIFYNENIITGERKDEDLLAHEIAHQWFGNTATEKTFAHLWLSEGFASYFTDLYIGRKYGLDSMNKRLLGERSQVIAFAKQSPRAVVDTFTTNYMQLLNANSYQKGAWILHMLRLHLGETVFMNGVRNYYKTYAGRNADTEDFRKIMEKASGKDLKPFFRQWLYTAGHPVLQLKHTHDKAKNRVTVTVIQTQPTAFAFPLDIEIQTAKGTARKTVTINRKSQDFVFEKTDAPVAVVADPGVKLLFEQ
jgi:aminopeptidase N